MKNASIHGSAAQLSGILQNVKTSRIIIIQQNANYANMIYTFKWIRKRDVKDVLTQNNRSPIMKVNLSVLFSLLLSFWVYLVQSPMKQLRHGPIKMKYGEVYSQVYLLLFYSSCPFVSFTRYSISFLLEINISFMVTKRNDFLFLLDFYKFIMIDEQSNSRMGTEKSETLKAVYDKVQQIKNQQGISMATQRQFLKNKIQMVHQTNLLLAINRPEELQKRRTSYSSNLLQTKKAFRFRKSLSPEKKTRLSECITKSERINHFLQLTKSKSMIAVDQKVEVQKAQQKARRSIIQFQQDKTHEKKFQQKQVKMLAKNYLRSSYSQKARLLAVSDISSSKKYLRKGYRIRQTLLKQLVKEGVDEVKQLGYMKQYNQLIPKILIQDKKMELSHLMRILKGEKLNLKHKNKFI